MFCFKGDNETYLLLRSYLGKCVKVKTAYLKDIRQVNFANTKEVKSFIKSVQKKTKEHLAKAEEKYNKEFHHLAVHGGLSDRRSELETLEIAVEEGDNLLTQLNSK